MNRDKEPKLFGLFPVEIAYFYRFCFYVPIFILMHNIIVLKQA